MPFASMVSCVSAVTLMGTLLKDSSRRVAVTVTSCSPPRPASEALAFSAGGLCASARLVASAAMHSSSNSSNDFEFMPLGFVMMLSLDPHHRIVLGLQQHRGI